MNITILKRIVRAGLLDFWRNGFVSFASILMMVFTLFIVGTSIFVGVILTTTLQQFRDKADLNVYFVTDASEDKILALQKQVEALPEVAQTNYVSRDEALASFRERHQNDQLTLQALDELGQNPLGATLNVRAKDISQYETIATFLRGQEGLAAGEPSIIDKINYYDQQHREAIDQLSSITESSRVIGFIIIAILMVTTIAISLNTLRMAIYTSRDEISVMRLVGAGKGYIRAPFVVEGILYGLIAGMVTLLLFYPLTFWLGSATENFFGGINVFSYYLGHFLFFILVIIGSGVALGAIASFLAVRRYLKI